MTLATRLDKDPPQPSRWLWLLPRVAFVLFAAAVAAMLWLSHQKDVDKQRATLISDMLGLEQNLRFQFARNEELLGQVGRARSGGGAGFEANADAILANSSGLQQIFWIDLRDGTQRAQPSARANYVLGEVQDTVPSDPLIRLVRTLGKPSYSALYPIVGDDWHFEVHVPVHWNGQLIAIAVGIYSLRAVLDQSVPWWLAERYRIAVLDSSGRELVARSKIVPVASGNDYQLPFEPPGYGNLLSATPYQAPFRLIDRLLMVAILGLAIATLASLWLVRKHVQQRDKAQIALRKEYLFRQAMENSGQTGLRARDLTGQVLYVNEAFCRMVGWPANELIGRRPPMPYWPPDAIEEIQSLHDRILAGAGPTESFEMRFLRRSGELFTALVHEAPLIDEHGRHTGWMASIVDISERKQTEEAALRQQERLQATARLVAMGEMASGLAHELNQPLAAIGGYCSGALNLLQRKNPESELIAPLAKAVEQTKRAGQIIRRIYSVVRRNAGGLESIDLADSVRSAISLVESTFRRFSVRVEFKDEAPGVRIVGDAVLLEQTLFNLLRNGGDAMLDVPVAQRLITIWLRCDAGYANLSIADRGKGIATDAAGRVFDPLFTTKAEGMGMGLSICRSVIEQHKGRIWFEANPEGGTIFHILLPIQEP